MGGEGKAWVFYAGPQIGRAHKGFIRHLTVLFSWERMHKLAKVLQAELGGSSILNINSFFGTHRGLERDVSSGGLTDFNLFSFTTRINSLENMMNALKLPATSRRLSLLALAGFAAICSTSAMAQDAPGFYVGGNLGPTRAHFNNDAYNNRARNNGFTINSSSVDNSSTGGKLFGGYQLNPNFAVEGGYFDLGRFNYSGVTSGGTYNGNTRSNGLNLDLVGTLPLSDRFSVLGRVGAAYARTRDSSSSIGFAPPITANSSRNDTHLKYGLGLQYAITDALSLRGELERYHRINDQIRRSNVDMASIGLVYRFGAKAQTPVAQTYVAPAPVYVAPAPAPYVAPAPVYVAPAPAPYVAPVRPAKEGRN